MAPQIYALQSIAKEVRGLSYGYHLQTKRGLEAHREVWLPPGCKPKTLSMKVIANDNELVK